METETKPKTSIFFKDLVNPTQLPTDYLPDSYRTHHQPTPPMIPSSSQDSLPKDPLQFTISPKIYLSKKPKLTRRIAVGSSDEEQQPQPSTTTSKKRKINHNTILTSDSDDHSSIEIIPIKNKKKRMIRNQSNTITSSSSSTREPSIEFQDPSITHLSPPLQNTEDQPTPRPRKLLNRRVVHESEQDDNESIGSDQPSWKPRRADHGSESEARGHHTVSEDDALRFFNSCDVAELPGVTACTLEQAKLIVSCRPFTDAEDMKLKLRKKKGVNSSILNHYQDMMKGYFEVDRVLSKCEKHGEELFSIMNIWAGRGKTRKTRETNPEDALKQEEEAEEAVGSVEHLSSAAPIRTDEDKKAFKNYIYSQPASVPKEIKLKAYQMLGINWLNLLYSKGLSCILADEMGLGKTAQVVCFLSHLKIKGNQGPHLVIVPSSTLENWIREFANFSSNLIVRAYYGSQNERMNLRYELKSMAPLDVVITTYNIATGHVDDRRFLERMSFDACVYDEGHQLKNYQSKRYKDLMRQKVRWRLLLTGTPLQNNLQELVSLLSFILPKIFGGQAQDDLRMIFKVPTDAHINLLAQARITRAKKMMRPFVLRRKKDQVLQDLPKKIEKIVYCDLDPHQVEIYNQIIRKSKKHSTHQQKQQQSSKSSTDAEHDEDDGLFEIAEELIGIDDFDAEEQDKKKPNGKSKEHGSSQKKALAKSTTTNVLMELRKASIHPMLFRRLFDDQVLKKIARSCLDEVAFFDSDLDLIFEDLQVMSDFEIHMFCRQYKSLNRYQLSIDHFFKSGKVQKLEQILTQTQRLPTGPVSGADDGKPNGASSGSRFLIFSQFTQVLQIIEQVLQKMELKYLVLTGQTEVSQRQELVDEFSEDETIKVFLLSTRAGGLGLNLTAADCVVLFDLDFNPHNDRQAEDRAYRLGQTRDVKVFKLISKGTIEEDVLQVASTKIQIDKSVSSSHHSTALSSHHLNLIKNIKILDTPSQPPL